MPDLVEVYNVTCAANITAAAPTEVALFNGGLFTVRKVTIIIPDGHSGLTGIAIAFGHQPVIPRNLGAFISGNDESIPYDLTGYPDGVAMSAFVCNLDSQPHVWQLRFEFDVLRAPPVQRPIPTVTPEQILAAGAGLLAA